MNECGTLRLQAVADFEVFCIPDYQELIGLLRPHYNGSKSV